MLFCWLLYSAAMTLWTGVKPPRLTIQPSDGLAEARQRVVAEQPTGAEPADALHPTPVADTAGMLALSGHQRSRGQADPEGAARAAGADGS